MLCGCCDPDCPCKGECTEYATVILYRIDMLDVQGLPMCITCADDALESGVFSFEPPKKEQEEDG